MALPSVTRRIKAYGGTHKPAGHVGAQYPAINHLGQRYILLSVPEIKTEILAMG